MGGCKLYFWFEGVPADRPGGAWWCRTFAPTTGSKSARRLRLELLEALRPFLFAYCQTDGEEGWDDADPPPGALICDSAGRERSRP